MDLAIENPLNFEEFYNIGRYKNSMLFGSCEGLTCKEWITPNDADPFIEVSSQNYVQTSVEWGKELEILEAAQDVRGDLARAILYMAVRYDGDDNDGVSDLELADIGNDEDLRCCFDYDHTLQSSKDNGCISGLCRMGQLSTILDWHRLDPPDDFERQRNNQVHQIQGNRNPFIDHPQLTWLLFSEIGSSEAFSDCGFDNSTIKTAHWIKDRSELVLTISQPVEPNQIINVTVPASAGIQLSFAGMVSNSLSLRIYANISGKVLSSQQGNIFAPAVGLFQDYPVILFENPLPSAQSDIFICFKLNCELEIGDSIRITLPQFSGPSESNVALENQFCASNKHVDTCLDFSCLSDCVSSEEQDQRFNATFRGLQAPEILIEVTSGVPTGELISLIISSQQGIVTPKLGISKSHHNITLWLNTKKSNSSIRFRSQGIGTFMNTSTLLYSKKIPNASVGLTLSFTSAMPMVPMDSILLQLPNFQIAGGAHQISVSNVSASSQIFSAEFVAIWTASCNTQHALQLVVQEDNYIFPGYSYSLFISNVKILLPSNALVANEQDFRISAECADGQIISEPVKSEAVAEILPLSISFWPALAGSKTNIYLTVKTQVHLTPGDYLYVSLKNFTGHNTDCAHKDNVNPPGWCSSISWDQYTSELSLRITADLQAGNLLQVTILSSTGISLPLTGISSNSRSLMLRAITAAGNMDLVPFLSALPVGTFAVNPSIDFSPKIAGQVTELHLSVKPSFDIEYGSMLTLSLSDFHSDQIPYSMTSDLRCFSSQISDGVTWNGTWNSTSSQFMFVISKVDRNRLVRIVLSSRAGIRIPDSGLIANDERIRISLNSNNGFVTDNRLEIPAVGVLRNKIIHLRQMQTSCSINISFFQAMGFEDGDEIDVSIPGFSSVLDPNLQLLPVASTQNTISGTTAGWSSTNDSIRIYLNGSVLSNIKMEILLGPFTCYSKPILTGNISISTNSRKGVVSETYFDQVKGFGSPVTNPIIVFFPANAGSNTSLNLSFSFQSVGTSGYFASIDLPGFDLLGARLNRNCSYVRSLAILAALKLPAPSHSVNETYASYMHAQSNLNLSVFWKQTYLCQVIGDPYPSTCFCAPRVSTVTFNATFTDLQNLSYPIPVSVFIPVSQGIILPINGTDRLGPGLEIIIQGMKGELEFSPVGHFEENPKIEEFSVPAAGQITALKLSFTLGTTLLAFEQIIISLPGFKGARTNLQYLEGPAGQKFSGSWIPELQILVLYLNCIGKFVLPGERILVIFPTALNIQLPSAGISANSSLLSFSISASAGSYGPFTFARSPGVGLFQLTSYSFLPPQAGGICSIIFKITPAMTILKGSNIYLTLPDFGGDNVISGDVFGDGNSISQANWTRISKNRIQEDCIQNQNITLRTACGSTFVDVPQVLERIMLKSDLLYFLTLKVSSTIPAGVTTSINISSSLKISIPPQGIQPNLPQFTVACDTPNQPVQIPVPISRSPGIYPKGNFLFCNITFGPSLPKMAGNPNEMVITFMPYMTFVDNDVVQFNLKGFTGPSFVDFSILSSPIGLTTLGSWNNKSQILSVRFVSYFENGVTRRLSYMSLTVVTFTIFRRYGISLPAAGIMLNSPQLLVSTKCLAGPVEPVQFTSNPAVYSVGSFPVSALTYNSMGFLCTKAFGGIEPPGSDPSKLLPSTKCTERFLGQGRVGTNTSINITFTAAMNMYPGDNITVSFKLWTAPAPFNFTFSLCARSTGCACNLQPFMTAGICASAQYLKSGRIYNALDDVKLAMSVSNFIPMNEPILLLIPYSFGLKIPINGVRLNDQRMTVESDAVAGPFPATGILKSDAVGSFGTSPSIKFSGGADFQAAGSITTIQFSFTPSMLINSYERIVLFLPDFTGSDTSFSDAQSAPVYCSPSISHLLGCGSLIRTGSWNSNSHELTLTVEGFATIPPNQTMTIFIGTTAGISTPSDGLASSQLSLTVRTNAAAGPVPPTPITYSQHIGLFNDKADLSLLACDLHAYCMFPFSSNPQILDRPLIFFDPPQAGAATKLKIKINPIMTRLDASTPTDYQGFKITLSLNVVGRKLGLTGPVEILGPYASSLSASMNGNLIVIQAQSYNLLRQRTGPIEITIPASAGFVVNARGNLQNDVSNIVQLELMGQKATEVLASPAIGVLQQPTLTYSPASDNYCISGGQGKSSPCPGKLANITFSFQNGMDILSGDVIYLLLPRFEGPSFYNTSVSISWSMGPNKLISSWLSTWNASDLVLSLTVPVKIPQSTRVVLTVPGACGIRIPSGGIPLSNDYFQVSVSSLMGNVVWTPFASTLAVPSMLSNFQLGVQPTEPGAVVTLGAKFLPLASDPTDIVLHPGDSVYLVLTGFTRDLSSNSTFAGYVFTDTFNGDSVVAVNMSAYIQQPPNTFSKVVWYGSLSLLWLTVDKPVASSDVSFYVSSTYGLRTPVEGLSSNDPSLQIGGVVGGILIYPTPCTASNAVGHSKSAFNGGVLDSRLQIDSYGAEYPVSLNITFALIVQVLQSETVIVSLPGFYRPINDVSIRVSSLPETCTELNCQGKILTASWISESSLLVLTLADTLNRLELVSVYVRAESGIYAPVEGLVQNQQGLTVSCSAVAGSISPTQFQSSNAVGYFLDYPVLSVVDDKLKIQLTLNQPVDSDIDLTLVLPGFWSQDSPKILFAWIVDLCERSISVWNDNSLVITIPIFLHNLSTGSSLGIFIPLGSDYILLPSLGLSQDLPYPSFQAKLGGSQTRITANPPVGSVACTKLTFDPAAVDVLSTVMIHFVAFMDLNFGDAITITLPDFVRPSTIGQFPVRSRVGSPAPVFSESCTDMNEPNTTSHSIDFASWDQEARTWNLYVTQLISAGTPVLVVADTFAMLPARGIVANDQSLTLAISAGAGFVPTTPIQSSPGIGTFQISSLTFIYPARAGKAVDLSLTFMTTLDLYYGDKILLFLPGFSGVVNCSRLCPLNLTNGNNNRFEASWQNSDQSIIFYLAPSNPTDIFRAGNVVVLRIGSMGGVALPTRGVASNQQSIQLSAQAATATVLPQPVKQVSSVGSFNGTEILKFGKFPRAGVVTDIIFSFISNFDLNMGDTVQLHLPGFTGKDLDRFPVVSEPKGSLSRISWRNNTAVLNIQAIRLVTSGSSAQVTIPTAAGIALPAGGVLFNHPGLEFSTASIRGPIPWTNIAQAPAVGLFLDSGLVFDPPLADGETLTTIRLNFTYARTAVAGEEFSLCLPGFTLGTNATSLDSSNGSAAGTPGVFAVSRWNQTTSTLMLTLARVLQERTGVQVAVNSFLLPLSGVRADDSNLTIATSARLGPVPATALTKIPAVGSFGNNTNLRWAPRRAGAAVVLQISLVVEMPLSIGDVVVLLLPGWAGAVSQLNVSSMPAGLFTSAAWSPNVSTGSTGRSLLLTSAAEIRAGTSITIAAGNNSTVGTPGALLVLPATGTVPNQQSFRLSTAARAGPVLPTPVRFSPGVVVVLGVRVTLSPAIAGSQAILVLEFSLDRPLSPPDSVILFLPSFVVENCVSFSDGGQPLCTLAAANAASDITKATADGSCYWNPGTSTMSISATKLNSFSRGGIGLPISFGPVAVIGLRLPQTGVRGVAGHAGVTLSVQAAKGYADDVPVINITAVGAFAAWPQTSIAFIPGLAGQPSAITLLAMPLFDVAAGELIYLTLCSFGGPNISISRELLSGPSAGLFRVSFTGSNGTVPRVNNNIPCDCPDPSVSTPADGGVVTTDISRAGSVCVSPIPRLILTARAQIPASTLVNLTVSSRAGILIPKMGLLTSAAPDTANAQSTVLLISSNAADGPVKGAPITVQEELDALVFAGLAVSPPIASAAATINMTFALAGPTPRGRICIVSLPGFSREAPSAIVSAAIEVMLAASGPFYVTWISAGPKLRLNASRDIVPGERVEVSIPSGGRNGLHSPAGGLPANSVSGITLACSAVAASESSPSAGALPPTPILVQTPFGRFLPNTTAVAFVPPAAGRFCALAFRFALSVALQPGEVLVLSLPGFSSGTSENSILLLDNSSDSQAANLTDLMLPMAGASNDSTIFESEASWVAVNCTLTLTVAFPIKAGLAVAASIPSEQGLRLPTDGIRARGPNLKISTSAADGPVLPVSFDTVTAVGAFRKTSLRFGSAPHAGSSANTTVSFVALMPLAIGDVIVVNVGSGFALDRMPPVEVKPNTSVWAVASPILSTNDGNVSIIILVQKQVPANTSVSTTLAGLLLPNSGVGVSQDPTFFAKVAAGAASSTVFESWQYVGSLGVVLANFLTDRGNTAATAALEIVISFLPSMKINRGEHITVGLPGFWVKPRVESIDVNCSGNRNVSMTAAWIINASSLILSVQTTIQAWDAVECIVPSVLGLQPPDAGFDSVASLGSWPRGNSPFIATDAAAGPVIPTQLPAFPSVAKLMGALVSFAPPTAGAPCSIRLRFQSSSPFGARGGVQFRLPFLNFPRSALISGLNTGSAGLGIISVFFTESQDWSNATWDPLVRELTVYASRTLPATGSSGTEHDVVIAESVGFQLRADGTYPYQESAWIRSLAFSCPSLRDYVTIQAVGAFNPNSTRISFYPVNGAVMASQPIVIMMHFVPYMSIIKGEGIQLHAPGFTVTDGSMQQLSVSSALGDVAVTWDSQSETLMLQLGYPVPAGSAAELLISGATLPLLGVAPAQAAGSGATAADGFYLSTAAINGVVSSWPIPNVQAVGALVHSSLSFSSAIAGAVSSLTLSFATSVELTPQLQILVFLPGFSVIGAAKGVKLLPGGCTGCSTCKWDSTQEVIMLQLTQRAAPLASVTVEIPYSSGVQLPAAGVLSGASNGISMAVPVSAGGPVPKTQIQNVEAVGAILFSSLSYDPPLASRPAAIRVQCVYKGMMQQPDKVRNNTSLILCN